MTRYHLKFLLVALALSSGCAQQRMNDESDAFIKSLQPRTENTSPFLDQLQTLRQQARTQGAQASPDVKASAEGNDDLVWHFTANQQAPNATQLMAFQLWHRQNPGTLRVAVGPAAADVDFVAAQLALERAQALQVWLKAQGLEAVLSYRPNLPAHQVLWLSSGGPDA